MKELFEYFRKRKAMNKPVLNADGEKFFGEIHMIFNDGQFIHTRNWQTNDVAMVVESKKV